MIEVSGLHFTYPNRKEPTLQGLDFVIRSGEIFGFLGPSGAGKSTTQKLLIGVLKGYRGSIKVMGNEIKEIGPEYYERIGVAFEFPNFYNKFSVLENLKLFRSLYKGNTEDPLRLLEQVDLSDAANMMVSHLSKGMKMRLNFCRALMHDPDILFLDEPTSGLDPVNAKRIKELILAKKAAGKTVLITTHNMQAAEELCDRVAFIVDGEIKLVDSPRELKLRNGRRLVRVEYRKDSELEEATFPLDDMGRNDRFLRFIQEFPPETIHSQEASLEQIFIEVTGRQLS
ncbi:ABC transporter ATP-binding protein [Paenibacillus glucanolyticus]|uniref:ABC transporter ATP-binding protein n=1 Tax=Paenibacillus glucanolyticus TaxID=59843 RepID=A0A163DN19_9BACL|nr:ABC transporter ATP-binding protein [Paenibacillus glucanolyticus]KZS43340.1 ABC transporter ATP-binding protein [Paenibacillus glucanolyticus]